MGADGGVRQDLHGWICFTEECCAFLRALLEAEVLNVDMTMQTIEYALNGLALRGEVIANNVANAEVPGFRGSKVEFEATLRRALDTGAGLALVSRPSATPSDNPVGAQDNNVDLEDEFVAMMKNGLLRQTMIEAYNFKAGLLRSAIGGQ